TPNARSNTHTELMHFAYRKNKGKNGERVKKKPRGEGVREGRVGARVTRRRWLFDARGASRGRGRRLAFGRATRGALHPAAERLFAVRQIVGKGAHASASRREWSAATTCAPSPMALPTRFTEPSRTSPIAPFPFFFFLTPSPLLPFLFPILDFASLGLPRSI